MSQRLRRYDPPSLPILGWLTDSNPPVPPEIREVLMAELFSAPIAVAIAAFSCIALSAAALVLSYQPAFVLFLILEITLAMGRVAAILAVGKTAIPARMSSTDFYLIVVILWSALQGAVGFTAMRTECPPLQILAATTIMGQLGPLCARNYAAPRLAFMLVCFCNLPFVAGAASSGEPWLMLLVVQAPLYLYTSIRIITHFRNLAVATLKAEQENIHRARHDELTGLLNRLGLSAALERRDVASGAPLAVLCLDLDGFKPVNDLLGHHMGDALLRGVARRLEANVRPGDAVVRLGGDEFVILADGLEAAHASELASRIIACVAAEPFLLEGGKQVSVGVSVGVACAPEDGTGFEQLHRRADAALYAAKAAGRGVQRRSDLAVGDDARPSPPGHPGLHAMAAEPAAG